MNFSVAQQKNINKDAWWGKIARLT